MLATPIQFNKFDIGGSFFKLSGTIKNSPSARAEVRKIMEPDTNNLLVAANELIAEATRKLILKGYSGLVILFDDLDKMAVRPMSDNRHSTDEHLFINRSPQMTGFKCHMVCTMPLSLAYSRHHQALKNFYSDRLPVVPMIKVKTPPTTPSPHQPGFTAMRKMVDARLLSITLFSRFVFETEDVCDELIRLSGGQPSELMGLIRDSLLADGLPIKSSSLMRVRREGQREFRRQLRREHWRLL